LEELNEERLQAGDLLTKSVGRRITGTLLGREEFHKDRAMPRFGDCAADNEGKTGKQCPATAQIALREA
jgi:NADH dehydrogenase FAD-containing subunit